MLTASQLEHQLEVEEAILDVLTRGSSLQPNTDALPGLKVYPNWIDPQQNRVAILKHLLDVARKREATARRLNPKREVVL